MQNRLKTWIRITAITALCTVLVACGGGGDTVTVAPSAQSPLETASQPSVQTPTPVVVPPEVAQLRVSLFGSGTISDAQGALDCQNQMCLKEYPKGAQTKVKAVAAPGWKFSSWTGCQSSAAEECSVSMNESVTVHPTFMREAPLVVKQNVITLKAETLRLLIKNEGGTLIFATNASEITTVKAGDVLVSTQGEGFARKIASVIAIPGGNFIVDTSPAVLTDVISSGTLIFRNTATTVVSSKMAKGVALTKSASGAQRNSKLTVDIPLGDEGFGLSGEVDFEVNPEWALDVGLFTGLQEIKAVLSPKLVSTLAVKVGKDTKFEKREFKLGEVKLAPLVFGPVVVVPSVEIVAHVKGEAKIEVTFSGTLEVKGTAGAHYYRGRGWSGVGSMDTIPRLSKPEALGSAEIEAGAGMQVTMLLWGVAGPLTNIGPYIKAESSIDPASLTPCIKWGLSRGVKAEAGGKVNVLGWELGEYEFTLFDLNLPIVDSDPGACKDLDPPTKPGQPTVTPSGLGGLLLAWTASNDASGIQSYEIVRDGKKIATSSKPTFQDSGLKLGQKYCYWVRAIDKLGSASTDSATGCGTVVSVDDAPPTQPGEVIANAISTTAIKLSWKPSTDNVGVVGYTISDAAGSVASTTTTTTDILKLQPGTQYCYSVTAFDVAGNLSAKSNQVCVTTNPRNTEAWNMKIKCSDRADYVVSKNIDIDIQDNQNISLVGQATDYTGGAMAYQLFGGYQAAGALFTGRINWTFANSTNVRADEFSASLNTLDTGDIAMNQVQRTGCDAQIRFSKN